MKIIFTVSMLANVLLLGFVGGHVYKKLADTPWHGGPAKNLSAEGRAIVDGLMKASVPDKEQSYAAMADMRVEMGQLLAADEFNADAFDALTSRMVTIKTRMTRDRMGTTKEIALSLQPQDRKQFAQGFLSMREKHWEECDKKPKPPGPAPHASGDMSPPAVMMEGQPPKGETREVAPPEMPDDMPPMPAAE